MKYSLSNVFVFAMIFSLWTSIWDKTGETAESGPCEVQTSPAPKGEKDGFFLLRIALPLEVFSSAVEPSANFVFAVDSSASMEASGLNGAGDVLERLLKALDAAMVQSKKNIQFNVVSFDFDVRAWRDRSQPLNADNAAEAVKYVRALRADGATDYEFVFKKLKTVDADAHLVIFTDGEHTLGETDMRKVAALLNGRDFSVVGCGPVCRGEVLSQWANLGGGFHYALPPEIFSVVREEERRDIAARVTRNRVPYYMEETPLAERLAADLLQPRLKNCLVKIEGVQVRDTYPPTPAPLAAGFPFTMVGRYAGGGEAKIVFSARKPTAAKDGKPAGATPFSVEYKVVFPSTDAREIGENGRPQKLAALWANARLNLLTEKISWLNLEVQRRGVKPAAVEWLDADAAREEAAELCLRRGFGTPPKLEAPAPEEVTKKLDEFIRRNPHPLTSLRVFPQADRPAEFIERLPASAQSFGVSSESVKSWREKLEAVEPAAAVKATDALAVEFLKINRRREATALWRELADKHPRSPEVALARANHFFNLGLREDALAAWAQARSLGAKVGPHKAETLLALGRIDEALNEFRALAREPGGGEKRKMNVRRYLSVMADYKGWATAAEEGRALWESVCAAADGKAVEASEVAALRAVFDVVLAYYVEVAENRVQAENALALLLAFAAKQTAENAPPYFYAAADGFRLLGAPEKAAELWLQQVEAWENNDALRGAALRQAAAHYRAAGFLSRAEALWLRAAEDEKAPPDVRRGALEDLFNLALQEDDWDAAEKMAAQLRKLADSVESERRCLLSAGRTVLSKNLAPDRVLAWFKSAAVPPLNTRTRREFLRLRAALTDAAGLTLDAYETYLQDLREALAAGQLAASGEIPGREADGEDWLEALGTPFDMDFELFLRKRDLLDKFIAQCQNSAEEIRAAAKGRADRVKVRVHRLFCMQMFERFKRWDDALAFLDAESAAGADLETPVELTMRADVVLAHLRRPTAAANRWARLAAEWELKPAEALAALAAWRRAGRNAEAARLAEALAERKDLCAEEWTELGRVLQELGRKEKAVAALTRARAADPAGEAAEELENINAAEGRAAEAVKSVFERAGSRGTWDHLFAIRRFIGAEDARQAAVNSLAERLQTATDPAERLRLHLLRGELLMEETDPKPAFAAFAEALKTAEAEPQFAAQGLRPWDFVRARVTPHKAEDSADLRALAEKTAAQLPPDRPQTAKQRFEILRLLAELTQNDRNGNRPATEAAYRAALAAAPDFDSAEELLGVMAKFKLINEAELAKEKSARFGRFCQTALPHQFDAVQRATRQRVNAARGERNGAEAVRLLLTAAEAPNAPPRIRRDLLQLALAEINGAGRVRPSRAADGAERPAPPEWGRPSARSTGTPPTVEEAEKLLNLFVECFFSALRPPLWPSYFWQAAANYDLDEKIAEKLTTEAAQADPQKLRLLATTVFGPARPGEAARCWELFFQKAGDVPADLRRNLVVLYRRKHFPSYDIAKALAIQKDLAASRPAPKNARVYFTLGEVQREAGDLQGAAATWRTLAADPLTPTATAIEAVQAFLAADEALGAEGLETFLNRRAVGAPWTVRLRLRQTQGEVLKRLKRAEEAEALWLDVLLSARREVLRVGSGTSPEECRAVAELALAVGKRLSDSAGMRKEAMTALAGLEACVRTCAVLGDADKTRAAQKLLAACLAECVADEREKYLAEQLKALDAKIRGLSKDISARETARTESLEAAALCAVWDALTEYADQVKDKKSAAAFAEAAAAAAAVAQDVVPATAEKGSAARFRSCAERRRATAEWDLATINAQKACAAEPFDGDLHAFRAEILNAAAQGAEAFRAKLTAAERRPNEAQALCAAAAAFNDHKEFTRAEAVLLRAIETLPNAPEPWLAYAALLASRDRKTEAADWLRNVAGKNWGTRSREIRAEAEKRLKILQGGK
jgi:hypothetical protein